MILFSLIIATYGREEALKKFLESVKQQTYRNVEVLIIDQNPPGLLDPLYAEFRSHFSLSVITFPVRNASLARNVGLDNAHGDIIAFPDDDCQYLPHTLARIASLFETNSTLGGILVSWAEHSEKIQRNVHISLIGQRDAFQRAGTLVQFYRKCSVEGIRFDPKLGPGIGILNGSGEDTDFLLQVRGKGVPIGRIHEVLVIHPEPNIYDPNFFNKVRSYALGRMELLRKHRFPLWFQLANVFFPLLCLLWESGKSWKYRKAMFCGRLQGLLRCHKKI